MTNPLRCVILDDEHPAVLLLTEYLKKTPGTELLLATTKPMAALETVESGAADLLFLDIQMPELTGIEIMQMIGRHDTRVIITTAYEEYALAGYHYNVVDYLLKPITFERFSVAISKAKERFTPAQPRTDATFIFIKTEYRIKKIELVDILYIEALGDYITLYLPGEKILSLERMKNIETILPAADFIRIHKSYIINIRHIDYMERGRIAVNKNLLPVGEAYKEMVKGKLGF